MAGGMPVPSGAFSGVSAAWQAHEGELLGYLRHRLADADTASDVLQDVFAKAMRHGQGFCTLDNPRAWLFHVARNTLIDRARATHHVEPLPDGDDEPAATLDDPPPPVDALASCLERTMAKLPADDAAILSARDLAGQTLRDFAESDVDDVGRDHAVGLGRTRRVHELLGQAQAAFTVHRREIDLARLRGRQQHVRLFGQRGRVPDLGRAL